MNELIITFVEKNKIGKRVYFWVNLQTEVETRQCCYTRQAGIWCYVNGDCEPQMNSNLEKLFYSSVGNNALNKCYKQEQAVCIKVK